MKIRDMVALDDEGNLTVVDGDEIVYIPCLGKGCLKKTREEHGLYNSIVVKREYGMQQLVKCPHCGQKLKIRCYKNGSVKEEIR